MLEPPPPASAHSPAVAPALTVRTCPAVPKEAGMFVEMSTPSTVPDTATLPDTSIPDAVVSNFLTLSWYNSTAPSAIPLK